MRLVGVITILVTTACYTGPAARHHPMVVTGRGAEITVALQRSHIRGELLEASDSALIVQEKTSILLVPRTAIRSLSVLRIHGGYAEGPFEPARLRSLARFSRYSGGMPPAVRAALLSEAEQDSLLVRAR